MPEIPSNPNHRDSVMAKLYVVGQNRNARKYNEVEFPLESSLIAGLNATVKAKPSNKPDGAATINRFANRQLNTHANKLAAETSFANVEMNPAKLVNPNTDIV